MLIKKRHGNLPHLSVVIGCFLPEIKMEKYISAPQANVLLVDVEVVVAPAWPLLTHMAMPEWVSDVQFQTVDTTLTIISQI